MTKLFTGPAVFSFPDGQTVQASVDIDLDDSPVLVTWSGTAESSHEGSLWNGGQRASTVRIGDAESGYRVGECMVIAAEPADSGDRVTFQGSGEWAEVATDD